jgi:6-phosphofructokinase 2
MLEKLLDEEGIHQHPIWTEKMIRRNFILSEESSEDQYRFIMPGPQLQESQWKPCLEELRSMTPKPEYVVGSGSLPPGVPDDFYARVAEITADFGARFIVDTSTEALKLAVQRGVYLIKPNLRELRELVDKELEEEFQQEEAAKKIIERGQSEFVVVSLGIAGALLVSRAGSERVRSPSVQIKSRIGAGDSMVAGITLKLAQGKSFWEAVRFGIAAGAAAVMTPGTELCHGEDVQRLYEKIAQENS